MGMIYPEKDAVAPAKSWEDMEEVETAVEPVVTESEPEINDGE